MEPNMATRMPLIDTLTDWWLRNDLFDPAGVFGNTAIFIESYPIRGGLARARQLGASASPAVAEATRSEGRPRADGLAEDAMVRRDVKTDDERERLLAGGCGVAAWSKLTEDAVRIDEPPHSLPINTTAHCLSTELAPMSLNVWLPKGGRR